MNKKLIVFFLLLITILISAITYLTINKTKDDTANKITYKYDNLAEFATIGTGGIKGTYYLTGNIISSYVNKIKSETGIRLYVESTAGSIYNINAIKSSEFDFGIVQADIAYNALKGKGKFEGKAYYKLKSVIAIYPELLTLITRENSNFKSLFSIKNKKVNLGNKGSDNLYTIHKLLEINKLKKSDFTSIEHLNIREASQYLQNNKIDAYFSMTGHPSNNIKNLSNNIDLNILSIDTKSTKDLIDKYPYFTSGIIKANTYNKQNQDIHTFGVKAILVTSSNVSEKIVYTIVKAILENFDEFKKQHPIYKDITKESLLEGLSLPLHRGAKKYFKDIGFLK
ncbi:MAG: TAXI family TRAP transporter solute-binding subunit [Campylobacteraceae bacterium]|nr:TAXI family TRAP transporter solute-binding subunit [Campylobacteraceae bacterium]